MSNRLYAIGSKSSNLEAGFDYSFFISCAVAGVALMVATVGCVLKSSYEDRTQQTVVIGQGEPMTVLTTSGHPHGAYANQGFIPQGYAHQGNPQHSAKSKLSVAMDVHSQLRKKIPIRF